MNIELVTEKTKIENVLVGDVIKCFDKDTCVVDYREVTEIHRPIVEKQNQVKIVSNGSFFITSDWHPTLLKKNGTLDYYRADEVTIGDYLIADDGKPSLVTDIVYDNLADENFYDLTVDTHHNYFVSSDKNSPAFVIHNTMALSDHLAKNEIQYDKSHDVVDKLFESIAYYTIETSIDLAKERGKYPMYDGSEWSKGLILGKLFYKGRYIECDKLREVFSTEEIEKIAQDQSLLAELFESLGE